MAKYSKVEVKKKLEELKEVFNQLLDEQTEEIEAFVRNEVIPFAPGMSQFMKSINPLEDIHDKHGHNPHPLSCGRCGRITPMVVPLGKYNATWSCKKCGIEKMDVEDEFIKCPHCQSLMTQEKIFQPGEPVSFDYNCKPCRENIEEQTKIATSGGAMVVCPKCRTTGTLPATDKQVIKFRKDNALGPEAEVRFILIDTQCPRCADFSAQRVFSISETNRIFLNDSDLLEGFHKETSNATLTKKKKETKPNVKKPKKSSGMVGDTEAKADEVPAPSKEVFFSHPGSKTFN